MIDRFDNYFMQVRLIMCPFVMQFAYLMIEDVRNSPKFLYCVDRAENKSLSLWCNKDEDILTTRHVSNLLEPDTLNEAFC